MRNGPKVNRRCLSKTWLYAGTSEYPTLLVASWRVTMRSVRTISREVTLGVTPQRPHAGARLEMAGKIWSVLHGDMQRPTEMIGPLSTSSVHSGCAHKEA
jgi:hypothetical protein